MVPFLKQIAEAFVDRRRDSLIDHCFVFPNKRCSTFFNSYLTEQLASPSLLPATMSIDELITDLTKSIAMSRIEQLFVLFDCYRDIVRKNTGQEPQLYFDSFLTWGETILNDFNDVDRYLADADQLFKNIKYFKEISSNFLTEEQVEIINRYWKDPVIYCEDARMWRHLDSDTPGETTVKNFFSLWIILKELYDMFCQRLEQRRLSYTGKIYRDAAELLKSDSFSSDSLRYKKYVFIGFNVLSKSEEAIFDYFRDHGKGDFYWDFASPAFKSEQNPATSFVGKYIKHYPSDPTISYDFESHRPAEFPAIDIIGIPSTFGQVKMAADILDKMVRQNPTDFTPEKARHTAVVLPDETLCIPLVNSLPPIVRPINITMGYPIRNTPVAHLIKNIIRMQERSRHLNDDYTFYFDDLKTLLSHPLLRSNYPHQCDEIIKRINDKHIFNFPRKDLIADYPELADFFIVFDDNAADDSLKQVKKLLQHLRDITTGNGIEHAFTLNYLKSLEKVESMCRKFRVGLSHSTIFQLLQRLAGGETVHFAGEPLEGIQIMGMLETRALDFENLIILSMNERIFPRKIQSRSFIPMELRAVYGLSTIEHQESIFAYYFYRLLTRARRVSLLYDSRTGTNSGEMSRYLNQLDYIFKEAKVNHINTGYSINVVNRRLITVNKTPEIFNKIEQFRQPGSGKFLSASSINRFIDCPLGFYLENIAGYRPDDEMKNYIDDGLYGTIMHSIAENLYQKASELFGTSIFTTATINRLAARRDLIEHEVVTAIKTFYYKIDKDLIPVSGLRLADLPGDTEIIADVLVDFTIKMLRRESESDIFGNFEFIGGEKKFEGNIKLTDRLTINLKGFIDRVDRLTNVTGVAPTLRFIDYKTGSDDIKVTDIDRMFDPSLVNRPKAVLQLMLYCNAYSLLYGYNDAIMPFIYRLKKISVSPLEYITVAGNQLTDYRTINDEFLSRLEAALLPLFDVNEPFRQAANPEKACKFCKFTAICDRQQK